MAANKRKILENARKYAQKGSKDKALKEYQKLVKLDPKDAKLRLEIGDAYRRWGQVDEAIETYTKVADQYMKDGFDARAVAVYKQILNLDPERYESYPPLAELYERMGLVAEAIGSLQTAADGYHRDGRKKEALELLRRMATIDPGNTTSRIKVAELLRQEGMNEEAILEYEEVATELARQGDAEAAGKVYKRVLEIEPDRPQTLVAFARNLLTQKLAPEAETVAKRALGADEQNPEHFELLAEVYREQGRDDLLPEVYRPLAELYRRRGDEDKARDILQRFVPPDAIEGGDEVMFDSDPVQFDEGGAGDPKDELSLDDGSFGDDVGGPAAGELELGPELELDGDGPLELSSPGMESDDDAFDLEGADISLEQGADATVSNMQPEGPVASRPETPPPISGDPDQLLAEASVYLRYGKRERAIAHLEAVLQQDPGHRPALEKLGEAHAEGGNDERAVSCWLEAAKQAQQDQDADAVAVLRGRIEALDADAAAALASPEPEPQPEPVVEEAPDLFDDEDGSHAAPDDVGTTAESGASPAEESDFELEIDLDDPEVDESDELDASEPGDSEPPAARSASVSAPSRSASGGSLSTTTAQQIQEDLEEADFYMEQGLHGEAEEIYQRVLALAPNHPKALLRLGEVAAARGEDPGGTGTQRQAAPAQANDEAAAKTPAKDEVEFDEDEISIDLDDDPVLSAEADDAEVSQPEPEPEPQPEREREPEPEPEKFDEESSDFDLAEPGDDGLDLSADLAAEVEDVDPVVEQDADPDVGADAAQTSDDETGEFSVPTEGFVERPSAPAPEGAAEGFDLAAELSDVFQDDDPAGASGRAGDDGFAEVFEAFKRGVSQTLSEADHEAHYDLGIAYKEMGLFDDAIQEFRAAMVHPPRVVECLHLIGLCALDGDQYTLAVEHLEQLLESDGATDEQCTVARFDLGRAHEALGEIEKARAAYEAVAEVDPDFQGVSERLAGLAESKPAAAQPASEPAGGDGFESFEDVMAEVEDEPEADPGESFQDLMDEVGDEDEGPEDGSDGESPSGTEPEAEVEPEPDPEPAKSPRQAPASKEPAKKKRKKISFL